MIVKLSIIYCVISWFTINCHGEEWIDTTWAEYPFMARLSIQYSRGYRLCGGSIISKNGWNGKGVVLTAAHCVDDGPENVMVYIGCTATGYISCNDGATGYNVDHYTIHPDYDNSETGTYFRDNDVALIFLQQAISHPGADRVELHYTMDVIENNDALITLGYGGTCAHYGDDCIGGSDIDTLEYENTNFMITSECNGFYGSMVSGPHDFCVKDDNTTNGATSACAGDDGSPLIFEGRQIGLVSWFDKYCDPQVPSVATSVPYYFEWIKSQCIACIGGIAIGGDGFIQLGTFRIGNVDDTHFSISSISGTAGPKTAIIFRNDGTVYPGPRTDFNFNDKPLLPVPKNVVFTNNGIEFGDYWCLGLIDYYAFGQYHLSITHNNKNGDGVAQTAMIWGEDGTRYSGPLIVNDAFSCWSSSIGNDVTVALDQSYIQFNDVFRIGATGLNGYNQQHLSIASDRTAVIYRDDGAVIPGPTDNYGWLVGGDGFIQLGTFRIGNVDDMHFSISSISGTAGPKTAIIFRWDGIPVSGPRTDFNFNDKPLLPFPKNVVFTNNGIEFGNYWCLGLSEQHHLSITHNNKNGDGVAKTAMIWRSDGLRAIGPRNDFSCWSSSIGNDVTISADKSCIQFNDAFRIGTTGLNGYNQQHLSIASYRTAVIYRDDGTVYPGPRDDFAWPNWTPSIGGSAARTEAMRMNDLFENHGNDQIEYGLYDDENGNYGKQLYWNEHQDKILMGLLLMVIIMTMINCYIYSKKTNNKKYQIVNMQESTDDEHQ